MALRKIVNSDATHKVYQPKWNCSYIPSDQLYIDGWYFTFGDVFSSALKNGEFPLDALARAEKFENPIYWLSRNPAILSATRNEEVEVAYEAKIGDTIQYIGKTFTIEKADNFNLKLFLAAFHLLHILYAL